MSLLIAWIDGWLRERWVRKELAKLQEEFRCLNHYDLCTRKQHELWVSQNTDYYRKE